MSRPALVLTPPPLEDNQELLAALERERDAGPVRPQGEQQPLLPLVELLEADPCPVCRVRTFRPCSAARTAVAVGCPGIEVLRMRVEIERRGRKR